MAAREPLVDRSEREQSERPGRPGVKKAATSCTYKNPNPGVRTVRVPRWAGGGGLGCVYQLRLRPRYINGFSHSFQQPESEGARCSGGEAGRVLRLFKLSRDRSRGRDPAAALQPRRRCPLSGRTRPLQASLPAAPAGRAEPDEQSHEASPVPACGSTHAAASNITFVPEGSFWFNRKIAGENLDSK
jgi:hypothetical protein